METLSKKQRYMIYKSALEYYINYLCEKTGICMAIDLCSEFLKFDNDDQIKYDSYNSMQYNYPELWNQKPKNASAYWWPISDFQSRINALAIAIDETK